MSKLILFNMISLDGFFEGPDDDLGWHVTDEEFDQFAIEQLKQVGAILFGRKTYMMMASFWTSQDAKAEDPTVADLMNNTPKVVFSHTLQAVKWNNSRLVKGNAADEIRKMKNLPGADLIIFGSSELTASLMDANLIDEFRLMVNPVILGNGRPMFKSYKRQHKLKLVNTCIFRSGDVLLTYEQQKE